MTIMIGIHQKQEGMDKLFDSMGLLAAPLTAVGPFSSKNEALAWQKEMQEKIADCGIIEPDGPDDAHAPWYGFSFEK